MPNEKQSIRAQAKQARAAADKSVKDGDPKEKQRKLAQAANELAEQAAFQDWVKIQEDAGYSVSGDSFANASVTEIEAGPSYNDKPGEVG
jgi:hypothetical protein